MSEGSLAHRSAPSPAPAWHKAKPVQGIPSHETRPKSWETRYIIKTWWTMGWQICFVQLGKVGTCRQVECSVSVSFYPINDVLCHNERNIFMCVATWAARHLPVPDVLNLVHLSKFKKEEGGGLGVNYSNINSHLAIWQTRINRNIQPIQIELILISCSFI